MRIRYEITLDDLLAFSLHVHQKSPTMRRNRMWAVFGLVTMLVTMCFVAAEITRNPIVLWIGVGGATILAAMYPRIYRHNVARLSKRLYAEGKNKALLGPHVAELRDNGLFVETDYREGTVFWKGIERVESIPGHTFVYLSAMSALAIPEHAILEGSYSSFIEELERRWQLSRGG